MKTLNRISQEQNNQRNKKLFKKYFYIQLISLILAVVSLLLDKLILYNLKLDKGDFFFIDFQNLTEDFEKVTYFLTMWDAERRPILLGFFSVICSLVFSLEVYFLPGIRSNR